MCFQWWIEDLGGMSDLCTSQLEDNVWDEFDGSDDHIVPHPSNQYGDRFAGWCDSRKKRKFEVIDVASNEDSGRKYATHGMEKISLRASGKHTMLEKDSSKSTPSSSASLSNHRFKTGNSDADGSEFCTDDSIIAEKSAPVESNLYHYPVSQVSHKDNDLSFFDKDQEEKESGDLLYYGWPEIENFEDVDRMFRSCDSTFGLGNLINEEEFCWFPPTHATEGSEDASKSSFKISCSAGIALKDASQSEEDFNSVNVGLPISASDKKNIFMGDNINVQTVDVGAQAGLSPLGFANGLNIKSVAGNDTMTKEQKEILNSSNQVQSIERYHGQSFDAPGEGASENREKPCQNDLRASFTSNLKHATAAVAFKRPVSTLQSDSEIEGHSEVEGVNMVVLAEIDSSNLLENSCVSSVHDEMSLEASSFRQLQQVIEQLDIRTKLCIRDGLYRLARSAEQRHSYDTPEVNIGEDKTSSRTLMVQETNKCTGFLDMETDTNPLDRSIAHLLFHRPSGPSIVSAKGTLSMKSPTLIHGSVTSPHVKADIQVFQEETAAAADKKILLNDQR